ncbi:hypothetical protein ACFPM0_27155 [Pseudonocardia sulfidoxydans]|uniref:hypothetical protein n=1 Tax=Pseudonocardia sulfidoxydans TaxID=54011 RepID=UPI00361C5C43
MTAGGADRAVSRACLLLHGEALSRCVLTRPVAGRSVCPAGAGTGAEAGTPGLRARFRQAGEARVGRRSGRSSRRLLSPARVPRERNRIVRAE